MIETELIVQLRYEATIDALHVESGDYLLLTPEDVGRVKRMFQAIVQDEKALLAIWEYNTIDDFGFYFGEERYKDLPEKLREDLYGEDLEEYQLLLQFGHIFTQEDRQWLEENEQHEDIYLESMSLLINSFKVDPSKITINKKASNLSAPDYP